MNTSISVIIPVYNEQQTISEVISRAMKIADVQQIIVVDDGSTDRTKDILREPLPEIVKVIRSEINHGKGWAVRQALHHASCEVLVIQDADLEYHPKDYRNLLHPIIAGQAEVVYGNRLRFSHFLNHPMHFTGNKLLTFLLNSLNLCNIMDVACGLKMFKRNVLKNIKLSSEGFEFDMEITIKILKAGFKIHSSPIPIAYIPRSYNEGKKFTWIDRLKTVQAVFFNSALNPILLSTRKCDL